MILWYCLASLVLQVSYWSPFILSNIWSLPDLSLPLPVTLPRAVSLHIRGRGRQVGAERCTERKMKFLGDTTGWGSRWVCRREYLLFNSSSKANSLRRGWITPNCQSSFALPCRTGKYILPFLPSKETLAKKYNPTSLPPLPKATLHTSHMSGNNPHISTESRVPRFVYNKIISFALWSSVHKSSWCINSQDYRRF